MIFHDSRDARFRFPGGALPCGARVRLRIRAEHARAVTLRLWKDGREWRIPMGRETGDFFSCEAAMPEDTGSLWYYFLVEEDMRTVFYGNAHDLCYGEGACYDHEPPSYQITLYDPQYRVPRWMREGIMMQIMVDRFNNAGGLDSRKLPPDTYYHKNWYDWPDLNLERDKTENSANDFFGGNLKGIEEKLAWIAGMGVSVLYLNPIFRSSSNHKYDTGNYLEIDPSFGTREDFESLCKAAAEYGIRVILDGVFSHTGADSLYFNKYGHYGENIGAYRDPQSPYRKWYRFENWPDAYECWWGFRTLPNVDEQEPTFREFIYGKEGVALRWMRSGASGWRLDVADELPMKFLGELRRAVKEENPDACLLGEVWEDPTNKIAYGETRCYCAGDTLDSVMNYPLREALFAFLLGHSSAGQFARRIEAMRESMPRNFYYSLMNLLGSHDRPRAINVLADCGNMQPERKYRFPLVLTEEQYNLGKRRLIAAWKTLCALPGMPCIYYGDDAGLTGMTDPFCRAAYPWGREDVEIQEAFRESAQLRENSPALRTGEMRLTAIGEDVLKIERFTRDGVDAFGVSAPVEQRTLYLNRANEIRKADGLELPAISATWRKEERVT